MTQHVARTLLPFLLIASAAFSARAQDGAGGDPGQAVDRRAVEEIAAETAEQTVEEAVEKGAIQTTSQAVDELGGMVGQARAWLEENGLELAVKTGILLAILLAFWILSGIVGRITDRGLQRSQLKGSQLLCSFIVSIVRKSVLLLGLLIGASTIGFQIGPLLAGLGVAGFVLGFALQDTLSNFAAGLMVMVYRPFDIGHYVNAGGVKGTVKAMTLVSTTIGTPDNQTLIVPNGKIWGDVITNVTSQERRRVDLTFGIGYGDDVEKTERVLAAILAEHPKVLKDPAPTIKLNALGESSVDFIVRPWVATADYWEVYWDVTRAVKMRFDAEGISIPFPQRDVHLYQMTEG